MEDKKYNGWTNYETWAAGMFIDGNYTGSGDYEYFMEMARESDSPEDFAESMQDYFKEHYKILADVFTDVHPTEYERINWQELAESKWEEARD